MTVPECYSGNVHRTLALDAKIPGAPGAVVYASAAPWAGLSSVQFDPNLVWMECASVSDVVCDLAQIVSPDGTTNADALEAIHGFLGTIVLK